MTAGELLRSLVRRSSLATSPNATIHHLITYNIVPKDTSVHLKEKIDKVQYFDHDST